MLKFTKHVFIIFISSPCLLAIAQVSSQNINGYEKSEDQYYESRLYQSPETSETNVQQSVATIKNQEDSKDNKKAMIGLQIGPNFSNTKISSVSGNSIASQSRTLLAAGINAELPVSQTLSIQPEVNYVQRGFEVHGTDQNLPATMTFDLNYIEIPLLLKAKLGRDKLRPYIIAGPSAQLLISNSITEKIAGTSIRASGSNNPFDNSFQKFTVGAHFGAGFEFSINSSSAFTIDIRYTLGLTNGLTNETISQNNDFMRNNSVLVFTGLKFNI